MLHSANRLAHAFVCLLALFSTACQEDFEELPLLWQSEEIVPTVVHWHADPFALSVRDGLAVWMDITRDRCYGDGTPRG